MYIKPGFILRNICGEKVLLYIGSHPTDMSKLPILNETGYYLWEQMQQTNFTTAQLAEKLCNTYDIDAETALHDVQQFLDLLSAKDIIG